MEALPVNPRISITPQGEKLENIHLEDQWNNIDWKKVEKHVNRLQTRIAKAEKDDIWYLIKRLQYLLTHSFYAKLLAIRKVNQNRGKRTAGIDGETWSSPQSKMKAAFCLTDKKYVAKPLKRVFIEKQGKKKKRPLGIPTMYDRSMQSLYALALEPIAEINGDRTSFGFRKFRSTHDACEYAFRYLCKKNSPVWILDGIEKLLSENFPKNKYYRIEGKRTAKYKVNFVRYADDFIVTANTEEIAKEAKELIKDFLKDRGLELSDEKTVITHIDDGFDFLGWNFRKYNGKLLVKPSKKSIDKFTEKISVTIKDGNAWKQEVLIGALNPIITGWANYHQSVVSSEIFHKLDSRIWGMLWHWAKRRHPEKSKHWIAEKYWHPVGKRKWVFSDSKKQLCFLFDTKIVRHIKLKLDMNPHLNKEYFLSRKLKLGEMKLTSIAKNVLDEIKNICKPENMTMKNNCCPKRLLEA